MIIIINIDNVLSFIGLGPSFVNLLSLSEMYTGKVVVRDFQVQIKIAIENSLLSKLPYETTYMFLCGKNQL
jgi:hypothetical protein